MVRPRSAADGTDAHARVGQAKLCNLLHMKELAKRLGPSSNVVANAVHPGAVTGKFNKVFVGPGKCAG